MRVVTYSRVSTAKQGDTGASLANQDRKFLAWCARGGHEIVRAYEESASAGSMTKRRTFQRMLDELDVTRPECIVVDTADRFSRNLEDAFAVIQRLRDRGINIWPLDWGRESPPSVITYDSDDYIRLRDEIIAAQHERRRIATRMKRSYEGRRERGATLFNNVPLGIRKEGDRLVPSDDAWLIAEVDRQVLAGASLRQVALWARSVHPKAWKRVFYLKRVLSNRAYLEAGVRDEATARQLAEIVRRYAQRFGEQQIRKHVSEWTGVFRCAVCRHVMSATSVKGKEYIICDQRESDDFHGRVWVTADDRITDAWRGFMFDLGMDDVIEAWAQSEVSEDSEARRGLARQLAAIDQRAAELKRRRDRAFDLLVDGSPAVAAQARKLLEEVEGDEATLAIRRSAVSAKLAALPPNERRSAADLRAKLALLPSVIEAEDARWRNKVYRMIVAAIGGNPIIQRTGRRKVRVTWPELEALRVPELAGSGSVQ